ncbi:MULTISPECIES: hypothetical protein [unclassified Fibrobacter]|uniref:hypothetical protein n=1 Tax=unclassified Fibrobacter TaxID=2634177 RepID=UPI000914C7D9|nr:MULTISPECIES: hypothetical protein [unclassified Fibrobacter]SHK67335.1 hypothetical protein SAMN05720759_10558 [Fibrobacter sp. UWB12]SIO05279.1 hypothetical protein SAMN05720758_1188 [Fibrobacter sp. UWB11]
MSLKKWKLVLASLSVALFTACAGSSNSDSGDTGYTGSNDSSTESSSYTGYSDNTESAKPAAPVKKEPPKEVINEKTLKKTQDEASAANEDNHKLRKEIFEARTKLGLPIQQPSTDAE